MRANEFIKKFGWDFAIAFSNKGEQLVDARPHEIGRGFINDLKRYVDAYELVQSYGGLSRSRRWVERTVFKLSDSMIALKNAITLVEECQ